MTDTIKRTFTIETTPLLMRRFERFLAMLHHNSAWGHSGLFAMPLDGDGVEKIKVSPKPGFQDEVCLVGGIGGAVEIARTDTYVAMNLAPLRSRWTVAPSASLYRDGELHRTYPDAREMDRPQDDAPESDEPQTGQGQEG